MLSLLIPFAHAADAQSLTLDEVLDLGVPMRHHADPGCGCVQLRWGDVPTEQTFSLQREDIAGLRHDTTEAGQHRLSLLLPGADDLVLEQGPCLLIADIAKKYNVALGLALASSDTAVCPTVLDDLEASLEDRFDQMVVEQILEEPNLAGLTVTDRRGEATRLTSMAQRDWSALRPLLGHCFTLDSDLSDGADARMVVDRDGTVRSVRIKGSGSGSAAVDDCLEARLSDASLPPQDKPARLSTRVSNPRS